MRKMSPPFLGQVLPCSSRHCQQGAGPPPFLFLKSVRNDLSFLFQVSPGGPRNLGHSLEIM